MAKRPQKRLADRRTAAGRGGRGSAEDVRLLASTADASARSMGVQGGSEDGNLALRAALDATLDVDPALRRAGRLALMRGQYDEFLAGESELRDNAESDDKFLLGIEQWQPKEVLDRKGRTTLTINLLPDPYHQIVNGIRATAPGCEIEPDDEAGHEDVADVLMGRVRHVNGQGNTFEYKMDAVAQQVSGGWGYWRGKTQYVPGTWKLDFVAEGIPNRFAVVDDCHACEPDRRDRKALFYIGKTLSPEEFSAKYTNPVTLHGGTGLMPGSGLDRLWTKGGIPVIEYWFMEIVDWKTLATKEKDADGKPLRTRVEPVWGVKMWLTNGQDVLIERAHDGGEEGGRECTYTWDGQWIPFVWVAGWRMNLAGEMHVEGMVRQARGAQRSKNYGESELIDHVGESTKTTVIAPNASISNYKSFWDTRNKKHWPYLPFDPVVTPGGVLLPTRWPPAEPPQGVLAAIQASDQNLMRQLGSGTSSTGEEDNDPSGYARQQRRQEHDEGRAHYMSGFAIAERFWTEIIVDLAPVVWGEERMLETLADDGTASRVSINKPQPHPDDPERDLPPGDERREAVWTTQEPAAGMPRGKTVKHYDLTVGKYKVRYKMGPNYATEREEQMQWLDNAAQRASDPAERLVIMYFWAKAARFHDHERFAQTVLAMLPPPIQSVLAEQDGSEGDDKQQVQQLRAQVAQLMPMVASAHELIQSMKNQLDSKTYELLLKAAEAKDRLAVEKLKVIGHSTGVQMQSETALLKEGMRGHHERMSLAVAGHIEHVGQMARDQAAAERSQAQDTADAASGATAQASQQGGGGGGGSAQPQAGG